MSRKVTKPTPPNRRQQTTLGGLLLTVLIVLVTRWWNSGAAPAVPLAIPTATAKVAIVQAEKTPTQPQTIEKKATSTNLRSTAASAKQVTATAKAQAQKQVTATPTPKKPVAVAATPSPTRLATRQATSKASDQPTASPTRRASATSTPANLTRAGPPGMETIHEQELPKEARNTLRLIDQDGPFPYSQDGIVFQNREGILPRQARGYYHEYTVQTPGSDDRGARRIVLGEAGEFFYTDDHYDSFYWVERD
jgi:ribonuclease T1